MPKKKRVVKAYILQLVRPDSNAIIVAGVPLTVPAIDEEMDVTGRDKDLNIQRFLRGLRTVSI